MPETITQRLDVIDDATRKIRVSLTEGGDVTAGGEGAEGDLTLRGSDGKARVRLGGNGRAQIGGGGADGKLSLLKASDNNSGNPQGSIHLNAATGAITAGGPGGGDLILRASNSGQEKDRISLSGVNGSARIGGNGVNGKLSLFRLSTEHGSPSDAAVSLDAQEGAVRAGGQGAAGQLTLLSAEGRARVHLHSAVAHISLRDTEGLNRVRLSGEDGDIRLGGNGSEGDLLLFPPGGANSEAREATMRLGAGGSAYFGGHGSDADLALYDGGGDNRTPDQAAIRLHAASGAIRVKGSLRYVDGTLRPGSGGLDGTLLLRNAAGAETVRVDGQRGDIILGNADCAEDFDLAEGEEWVAGAVMVLGEDGSLRVSTREYDTAVAGVVSGAGSYRPGLVLDRRAGACGTRVPVAMLGKVFCLVDADFGAVRPGALLTTSPRRGHAMRASDPSRAFGAVIGKALKPLEGGQALVPVMVCLQ